MGEVVKRISYLNLTLECGTERVPDDGRFYVVRDGELLTSAPSASVGLSYLEMAEEEILEANPDIRNPRALVAKERATRDIIAARAESAQIGKSKATAKGGRGGRSGV